MGFEKIKKYPSQISSAFKRFPLASALAIFTSIAFICVAERSNSPLTHRFEHWLLVYPIAAMLISLTVSLVQESRQNLSKIPQIAAGAIWLAISIALTLYFPQNSSNPNQVYVGTTYLLIYTTAFLSFFIAPFFKQKDENGFWNFLTKNIKSAVIAIVIAHVLGIAINLLLLGFYNLFDIKVSEKLFLDITIFCSCTVGPILFFSGIPSISDCLQETPALNKFETSTNRFIFLPVVSLYIALLYAYIVKIIIQWEMPKGMVSFLVSASMLLMLLQVTLSHPERINPKRTFEKPLLKILPTACIPLVILMSVGIFRRIADYGISESRYYVLAINIFFYAVIAILLNPKIICKSKYIAIVFCSMFFIATNGPLSAYNVTHRVWMGSIKDVLADLGYTNFPLSKDETVELGQRLQNKSDHKTNIATSRLEILNSKHDEELAQYITNGEPLILLSRNPSANKNADEPFITKHINNSSDSYFDIPKNATKVSHFSKTIRKEDYELRNDTLFFKFKAKKIDKTFDFFITKQALEQKDVKTIQTEGAQISVESLDVTIWDKPEKNNYFHISGILFLE